MSSLPTSIYQNYLFTHPPIFIYLFTYLFIYLPTIYLHIYLLFTLIGMYI